MKTLLAQINTVIGDLDGNTSKIIKIIEDNKNSCDLLVFPELTITGYPPLDLIEQTGFFEEQYVCLQKIAGTTEESSATVIVGYFDKNKGNGKPFHNSMAVLQNGKIAHIYYKRLLPTYNIFDESRHFEPGKEVKVIDIKGRKVGLLICEDMWNDKAITNNFIYPVNPVEETIKAGAEMIVSINASPSQVGKPEYRLEKFARITKEYGVPLVYVNQVGGNDDIVFDGTSFVINADGAVACCLQSFKEQVYIAETTDNTDKIEFVVSQDANLRSTNYTMTNPEFYFNQIVLGIRDYMRKCGFKRAVVASSGGVDSALVLALAVESENRVAQIAGSP